MPDDLLNSELLRPRKKSQHFLPIFVLEKATFSTAQKNILKDASLLRLKIFQGSDRETDVGQDFVRSVGGASSFEFLGLRMRLMKSRGVGWHLPPHRAISLSASWLNLILVNLSK